MLCNTTSGVSAAPDNKTRYITTKWNTPGVNTDHKQLHYRFRSGFTSKWGGEETWFSELFGFQIREEGTTDPPPLRMFLGCLRASGLAGGACAAALARTLERVITHILSVEASLIKGHFSDATRQWQQWLRGASPGCESEAMTSGEREFLSFCCAVCHSRECASPSHSVLLFLTQTARLSPAWQCAGRKPAATGSQRMWGN